MDITSSSDVTAVLCCLDVAGGSNRPKPLYAEPAAANESVSSVTAALAGSVTGNEAAATAEGMARNKSRLLVAFAGVLLPPLHADALLA